MKLHQGLTEEYAVEGMIVYFRGEPLCDLREQRLADVLCRGEHCNERFLDEVVCAPPEPRKARLKIVKKVTRELRKREWLQ
jgi:hypothetical protein